MEQFQINESCLVRAPAFHARPAEETSPSLPASFFLGEQKQRPKPERGYNFKLLTLRGVGEGGEEGVTSQFPVLLSKWGNEKSKTQSTEASVTTWGPKKWEWVRPTAG